MERSLSRRGKGAVLDMTEGPILGNILLFALPLLAGNLFQQLYNMVDTWVIGQRGVEGAYAAVGSVAPVINILIGFFSGLASGAGVVISQYFGAKEDDNVKKAVHTSMLMTFILGIVFTVVGVIAAPWILRLMLSSDGELGVVYPHAKTYLTIYFSGVMGMMLYNMGAGVLRAVGDSRRPFYFLIVSALTNIVLDLVFVYTFDMGVAGVAIATVISQWISAILTLLTLFFTDSVIRLRPKELRIDTHIFSKIVHVGIPAALQLALTAFSNVFVQSYIGHANGTQANNLGGWTTYSKVDQLIFLPVQSLSLSVTTFVGQNLGRGDTGRARRGTLVTFLTSLAFSAAIIVAVMIFAPYLAAFFTPDQKNVAIVDIAVRLLTTLTPFYLICSVNQVFSAAMRGAGESRAPMVFMLLCFVGFRQLYLYVMSSFISNDLIAIGLSYPAGWIACAACVFIFYRFFFSFDKNKLLDKKTA